MCFLLSVCELQPLGASQRAVGVVPPEAAPATPLQPPRAPRRRREPRDRKAQAFGRLHRGGGAVGAAASATGGDAPHELVSAAPGGWGAGGECSGPGYSPSCVRREQEELIRQQEASVSEEERREVEREQERLLVKMEQKGEQISKLYKHLTQVGS